MLENNSAKNQSHDYEVDFWFFLAVFRRCWYWIVIAALLFGLATGVFSSFFIEKKYSSTVKMYVDPSSAYFNSSAAEELAGIYTDVISDADSFAKKVALRMALLENEDGEPMFPAWKYETVGDTKVPTNWRRVFQMMTAVAQKDTIFYITIRSTNPQEAYQMAVIATEVAPELLNEVVGFGTAKTIGHPTLDTVPDSPNVTRNVMFAACLGAVIVYVIFFLLRLFDMTIYGEKDLSCFDLPVLGMIPLFPDAGNEKFNRAEKEVASE